MRLHVSIANLPITMSLTLIRRKESQKLASFILSILKQSTSFAFFVMDNLLGIEIIVSSDGLIPLSQTMASLKLELQDRCFPDLE
jgi:hypothetical protein